MQFGFTNVCTAPAVNGPGGLGLNSLFASSILATVTGLLDNQQRSVKSQVFSELHSTTGNWNSVVMQCLQLIQSR